MVKIKYLNSFYYCSNSPKGLLERLRIMGFAPGDSMNKFYKIEIFLFRSPQIFGIVPAILKERGGDNLGDGKFSGFTNFRISGFGILKLS